MVKLCNVGIMFFVLSIFICSCVPSGKGSVGADVIQENNSAATLNEEQVVSGRDGQYYKVSPLDVAIPNAIGGFKLGKITTFDDSRAGFSVGYDGNNSNITITVFIYPVVLPKNHSLEFILEDGFRASVYSVQQQYGINSDKKIEEIIFAGNLNGNNYNALKADFVKCINNNLSSSLYLTIADDVYIKIRATYNDDLNSKKQIDEFASELLTKFKFNNAGNHKHNISYIYTDNTFSLPKKKIATAIIYRGIMVDFLKKGYYLDSFERQELIWNAVLDHFAKIRLNKQDIEVDDTIEDMYKIRNAGYLKEYIWAYFKRPYWGATDLLRLDDFAAWKSKELKNHSPFSDNTTGVRWVN